MRKAIIISLIQHFEADFLWKVSLKILNSGIILKTFTHKTLAINQSNSFVLGICKLAKKSFCKFLSTKL